MPFLAYFESAPVLMGALFGSLNLNISILGWFYVKMLVLSIMDVVLDMAGCSRLYGIHQIGLQTVLQAVSFCFQLNHCTHCHPPANAMHGIGFSLATAPMRLGVHEPWQEGASRPSQYQTCLC